MLTAAQAAVLQPRRLGSFCNAESAAGNPSSPTGQLPLHKGAFFQPRHPTASLTPSAAYPHKQGAVFNCPGTPNLFHRRTKGRCPRGEHLLGALWFFLAARKNNHLIRAVANVPPHAIHNLVMMQPSPHRPSYSPYALKAHPCRLRGNSKHPSVTAKHTATSPLSHLR